MNTKIYREYQLKNIEDIKCYLEEKIRIQDFEIFSTNQHPINPSFVRKCIALIFAVQYCKQNIKEFQDIFEKNENLVYKEYCKRCQKEVEFVVDSKNKTIMEIDVPCTLIDMVEFDVEFESGKLFLGDYFRLSIDIFEEFDGNENINYVSGQIERTMNYAKENVIHLFVGGDGIALVNNDRQSLLFNESKDIDFEDDEKSQEIFIGGDLRWLTIIDIETIKKRIKSIEDKTLYNLLIEEMEKNLQDLEYGQRIVNLEAGKYHIKYNPYTNDVSIDLIEKMC